MKFLHIKTYLRMSTHGKTRIKNQIHHKSTLFEIAGKLEYKYKKSKIVNKKDDTDFGTKHQ
jgi:hypothetical protein